MKKVYLHELNHTIYLQPAEEGGYTVTVPTLPAVVTEGDTYKQAIAMTKDAICLYLQFEENERGSPE